MEMNSTYYCMSKRKWLIEKEIQEEPHLFKQCQKRYVHTINSFVFSKKDVVRSKRVHQESCKEKKKKQNKTFLLIISSFSKYVYYIMCIKLQFNRRAIPFCLLLKSFIISLSTFTTFKG